MLGTGNYSISNKLILKISAVLFFVPFLLYILFPFYWMLKSSLQTPQQIFMVPPMWLPMDLTLDAYLRAVTLYPIPRYLVNSFVVAVITAVLATVLASMSAYVLARYKFPGAIYILIFILFAQLIPGITRLFPIYFIIQRVGLLNNYIGLIFAYLGFSVPYSVLLLQAYFKTSCPLELEEAALIDGCSFFSAFVRVVLPISIPGIVAASIYTFLGAWNDFMWASLLLNQGQMKTVQVGLRDFMGEAGNFQRVNSFMAACTLATIPAVVLFGFLQKGIVSGLSSGSVKG